MPPDTNDILYAPLGTMTYKRGEDGFLYVTGTVSTDSLDLDNQQCDPVWLEKAIPEWFKSAGNVRVMHQPQTGGKAKEISQEGNAWSTVIKVTNPQAALDIEEGVLTGLSVGIKGHRLDKSDKALQIAPEGIINDGKIVEVSFVDRPANPDCKVAIMKMEGGHLEVTEDVEIVEKRDFTDAERETAAKKGQAMPGGGFPVKNLGDLKNAISAIGRAKDPAAAEAHIKSRAKALGKEDLIPSSWKSEDPDLNKADEMKHAPADLAAIRTGLGNLMKAELDELIAGSDDEVSDLYELLNSLSTFLNWWDDEADEGEVTEPFLEGDDTMAYVGLGVSADLIKSASADDATDEVKSELRAEIVKALGLDGEIVTKAEFDAQQEAIKGLEAALKDVREMAAPGQPALRAQLDQQNKSSEADELENRAARFIASAYAVGGSDKAAAAQYVEAAEGLTKQAKALRESNL